MTRLPNTNGVRRSIQKPFFLKFVLCVLLAVLAAKTAIDLSKPDNTTTDFRQTDTLSAEAYKTSLAEQNLELVEGSLHEPSDPTRKCQSPSAAPNPIYGVTTLAIKNDTKVVLTLADCHPCNWPIKPSEDVSAYALLQVKVSNNLSFSIQCYVGGVAERSSGAFSIRMPLEPHKRKLIQQIIQQIAEDGVAPNRTEYNRVLRELFTPGPPSNLQIQSLAALLCRSVDISLNPR